MSRCLCERRIGECQQFSTRNRRRALLETAHSAGVAKLVDAPDLGSGAARRGGSSPSTRTITGYHKYRFGRAEIGAFRRRLGVCSRVFPERRTAGENCGHGVSPQCGKSTNLSRAATCCGEWPREHDPMNAEKTAKNALFPKKAATHNMWFGGDMKPPEAVSLLVNWKQYRGWCASLSAGDPEFRKIRGKSETAILPLRRRRGVVRARRLNCASVVPFSCHNCAAKRGRVVTSICLSGLRHLPENQIPECKEW